MDLQIEFLHAFYSVAVVLLFRIIMVNVTPMRLSFESVVNLLC